MRLAVRVARIGALWGMCTKLWSSKPEG